MKFVKKVDNFLFLRFLFAYPNVIKLFNSVVTFTSDNLGINKLSNLLFDC